MELAAVNADADAIVTRWGKIQAGNLEVRLARSLEEITAAQALRYHVFFEEMGGTPSAEVAAQRRDYDRYDPVCDHLLVLSHHAGETPEIVGTYRLLRRSAMREIGQFYTESEFIIDAIKHFPGEIMELGRSCVRADHRNRAVMQLLWRGITAYVLYHDIALMFGCASLPGTDIAQHAHMLSYLYHYHLAPPELRARALPERYVRMNILPRDQLNAKAAFAALPPLVKGYLRLNGYVGDGAVLDHDCNTTDVCVVVQTALVTEKYVQRYASPLMGEDGQLPA